MIRKIYREVPKILTIQSWSIFTTFLKKILLNFSLIHFQVLSEILHKIYPEVYSFPMNCFQVILINPFVANVSNRTWREWVNVLQRDRRGMFLFCGFCFVCLHANQNSFCLMHWSSEVLIFVHPGRKCYECVYLNSVSYWILKICIVVKFLWLDSLLIVGSFVFSG